MRAVGATLALCAVLAACGPQRPPAAEGNKSVIGTPAPGSKFAKVRIGMGEKEVTDLIGPATDVSGHITGKAFIPFYFGSGTVEVDAHYRGEGILTYASGGVSSTVPRVIIIKVDRSEGGYVR